MSTIHVRSGIAGAVGPTGPAGVLGGPHSIITLGNGANENVNIGSSTYIIITGPTAAFSIGGFTNGSDGKILNVLNFSAQLCTINNLDSGSTVTLNQISTPNGANVILNGSVFQFASFYYENTQNVWRLGSTSSLAGAWQAATLQNSWTNLGGGYSPARYRIEADGVTVRLDGMITSGTLTNGTVLFNLPVGYYNPTYYSLRSITNTAGQVVCGVFISTAGAVEISTSATQPAGYVSLDGITFPLT